MADETKGPEDEVPSWLGEEGLDSDLKGDPKPGWGGPRRFWMPKATEKKIVFLTDGGGFKVIWEHNLKIGNGKRAWQNWATCLQPLNIPCPICQWSDAHDGQFGRYKAAVGTIIDTSSYTDGKGKVWVNQRNLFVAKKDTAEILKRKSQDRKEEKQSLRFALFKVYRTNSDKSASVGEDFTFLKMIDPTAFKPEELQELDYPTILKPDPEKAKRMLQLAIASGAGTGGGRDPFADEPSSASAGGESDPKVKY